MTRLLNHNPAINPGKLFILISLAIAFILAYSQSPLFTSNQNQYFLHGLARAGFGNLDEDWLANTAEPTPVFSLFVEKTYEIFGNVEVFYLFYPILLAAYFLTILAIVSRSTPLQDSFLPLLIFSALIIAFHSAGLRFSLSKLLAPEWSYIFEDGLADQRLLGPVFQPSTFGVLLLISIYLFLIKHPFWAVVFAALSAVFHPTYLLSAGSLVLAYMLSTYYETREIRSTFLLGSLGFLLVFPILTYVFQHFAITPSETTLTAQGILVNIRLPHHAMILEWFDIRVVLKIILILVGLYLIRTSRLFLILSVPFLVGLIGSILTLILQNNTLALVFPWRISTFLLPLSVSIILAFLVSKMVDRFSGFIVEHTKITIILCVGLISLCVLTGIVRMFLEAPQKINSSETMLYSYAKKHADPGVSYLIPIKMQEFRLASGAPVYIDYKSIPYKDEDVIEWYRRIRLANRFYKKHDCSALEEITEGADVDYIVLPFENEQFICPGTEIVYTDKNYSVYSSSGIP